MNKYWTDSSRFGCLGVPERPWGVTILGTLFGVNGAFQSLFFFMAISPFCWAWCTVFLLLSASSVLVAFGLLVGEDWAWKLTLVLQIIYIAVTIGLFALDNAMAHLDAAFLVALMRPAYPLLLFIVGSFFTPLYSTIPTNIGISVSVLTFVLPDIIIILYLMLPHVKAFFSGTESSIQKSRALNTFGDNDQ
jgi:hypothetical protein